jgi:hypothetical protein
MATRRLLFCVKASGDVFLTPSCGLARRCSVAAGVEMSSSAAGVASARIACRSHIETCFVNANRLALGAPTQAHVCLLQTSSSVLRSLAMARQLLQDDVVLVREGWNSFSSDSVTCPVAGAIAAFLRLHFWPSNTTGHAGA